MKRWNILMAGVVACFNVLAVNTLALAEANDPLVQTLVQKGILNARDLDTLKNLPPEQQRDRLTQILKEKGVLSQQEVDALGAAPAQAVPAPRQGTVYDTIGLTPYASLAPGATLPAAVPPVRPLPIGVPQLNGLTGSLNLGGGVAFQPYGTIIATYQHDSSSPYGNAFPLPGFIGDVNGPSTFPENHLQVTNSILGANLLWADLLPGVTASGLAEMDFNGGFSVGNALNAQSISEPQPRLTRAFGRVDYCANHCQWAWATDVFFLAGQDWTPFASSTQPDLLEKTLDGVGFGNIAARLPQLRIGVDQKLGTFANLHISPEFAVVQSAFGNVAGTATALTLQNQLGEGERQGADASTPELQARIVVQAQLDPAEGVAPAQFIVSGMEGERRTNINDAGVPAAFKAAFPNGAEVTSHRHGFTVETQIPTRWLTVSGKYYNGTDLRFYGGGELLSEFNNTSGLKGVATGTTVDGAGPAPIFGLRNGVPTLAPQEAPRSQGGFVELGLPVSRWFGFDPLGWNGGWTAYLTRGI
ncbi:MAG TPA: hypothetical protein VKT70_08125, partial [Stellaceae bacterium]|nr:hypothetical protein [Stellaceae bacterium]